MHSSANCWTINWIRRSPTRPTFSRLMIWLCVLHHKGKLMLVSVQGGAVCYDSCSKVNLQQLHNKLAILLTNIKGHCKFLSGLLGSFVVDLFVVVVVFYKSSSMENTLPRMGRIIINNCCLLQRNVHSDAHLCQIGPSHRAYALCCLKLDPHALCFVLLLLYVSFHSMACLKWRNQ